MQPRSRRLAAKQLKSRFTPCFDCCSLTSATALAPIPGTVHSKLRSQSQNPTITSLALPASRRDRHLLRQFTLYRPARVDVYVAYQVHGSSGSHSHWRLFIVPISRFVGSDRSRTEATAFQGLMREHANNYINAFGLGGIYPLID